MDLNSQLPVPATSALPPHPGIDALLWHVPCDAERAERHLWLIAVLRWMRRGDPAAGLRYVLRQWQAREDLRGAITQLLAHCLNDLHLSGLMADHGFAPRAAFLSELGERIRRRVIPASPDTRDLSHLFGLLFDEREDHLWLAELDADTLALLGQVFAAAWQTLERPQGWRVDALNALGILAGQVRSAGMSAELRLRLGDGPELTQSFGGVARATEDLHDLLEAPDTAPAAVLQQVQYLRGLIDTCVRQAQGVHEHLETYGVSVDVVFQIDQLCARCRRMEQLLALLLAQEPHREVHALVVSLIEGGEQRRSIRALFTHHYSLLARLVAERSAETGEHYITRTRAGYFEMLRRAAGGGALMAGTTFAKFAITALGLSAFWGGLAAGTNYAISFVLIQLLHFTVATKQPAMTAPAMAAKLGQTNQSDEDIESFVDEVVHLLRSQVAGIVGNLVAVAPLVLGIQSLAWYLMGQPLISVAKANQVLQELTLLGPTLLFAAMTGVLLFISSLIAGWVENWFVWHRLDSAMQWHPRTRAWLGPQRAARWAQWWRAHISGLGANVSLGLLLGLTPALFGFFGLPLDVRHVTLSAGQVAAALGTLGFDALHHSGFWWCVVAIPLTGLLNVSVSFALALRVAIRSRGVRVKDRSRLLRALGRRLLRQPGRFLWPPSSSSS